MSSIPSQLPQFVTAARSGALQALALQAGQVLDAKILGAAPNGGTQVEIRGQLLNLVLPTLVKAGDTIKLEVQGSGQQLRLALQLPAATVSPSPSQPAPAAPHISVPLPAPSTQTLPSQAPAAPSPGAAQSVPVPATMTSPAPNVAASVAPPAGQPQSQTAPATGASQPAPSNAPATAAQAPIATTPGPAVNSALPSPAAQAPVVAAPIAQPTQGAPVAAGPAVQVVLPTTGYPTPAAAGLPNPQAVAAAGLASQPSAPLTQTAMEGAVRPVVAATTLGNATAHQSPGSSSQQPQMAPAATTPQAALAQMVQAAVPRQGAVTGLTTALVSIAGKVVLPEPVARAAQQVLAGRVTIDGPRFDGSALQAAVRGSGVFQEASLAKGQSQLLQPDMKTALLTLRQTLTSWLGQQAPVAAVAPPPPPLRGITPRARASDPPPIDTGAPSEEVGKQLLERTESALARVRLHQHASLPDPTGRTADWSMDLPVMVGTQQSLMQFQIHRDQQSEGEATGERGWQMKFALNLPGMGEVGAQVSLRAGTVGVMLWATEPAASEALDTEIAALKETLIGAGLHPGSVIVRHGEPPAPVSPPSGHFVDSRT